MSAVLGASYITNTVLTIRKVMSFFTISKKISMHLMETFHLLPYVLNNNCRPQIHTHSGNLKDAKNSKKHLFLISRNSLMFFKYYVIFRFSYNYGMHSECIKKYLT